METNRSGTESFLFWTSESKSSEILEFNYPEIDIWIFVCDVHSFLCLSLLLYS